MKLNTQPNLTDPDGFYSTLTELHRNLDSQQSECVNARLILLLANHIGEQPVLLQAMNIAADIE